MKKYSVIILLALAALLLTGCTNDGEKPSDTTTAADTTTSADTTTLPSDTSSSDSGAADTTPDGFLHFVENNKFARIVYGANASQSDINTIKVLFADRLASMKGWEVTLEPEGEYDANSVEVVFGDTSYPESREVLGSEEFNFYGRSTARVVGNKLVVAASPRASYNNIISDLILFFAMSEEGGESMKVSADYRKDLSENNLFSYLPEIPNYKFASTSVGDGCYKLDFTADEANSFADYPEVLLQNGFELYAKSSIDDNSYATYVSDKLIVTTVHTGYNNKCKLLVDPRETTALPAREADNKYTPVSGLSTTLTQLGCFYDHDTGDARDMKNFNGMSYVVRLADGSFIVVDGGHAEAQADNLYNVMKKQSPSEKIVIAAWIFSHDHSDHLGFFDDFTKKYADKVTVEQFIYNFPRKEQFDYDLSETARDTVQKDYADSEFVKAHPGQVFFLRDVKITMLYTVDVYESSFKSETGGDRTNNVSMVWQLEFADGTTFISFGDYEENSETLLKLYSSETLKSDVMQVPHHGMGGQNDNIYNAVRPEYVFFPVGAWELKFYFNGEYQTRNIKTMQENRWLFNSGNIKQENIYLAADDICVMTAKNGNISVERFEDIAAYTK